jgi:hypothetical protein
MINILRFYILGILRKLQFQPVFFVSLFHYRNPPLESVSVLKCAISSNDNAFKRLDL